MLWCILHFHRPSSSLLFAFRFSRSIPAASRPLNKSPSAVRLEDARRRRQNQCVLQISGWACLVMTFAFRQWVKTCSTAGHRESVSAFMHTKSKIITYDDMFLQAGHDVLTPRHNEYRPRVHWQFGLVWIMAVVRFTCLTSQLTAHAVQPKPHFHQFQFSIVIILQRTYPDSFYAILNHIILETASTTLSTCTQQNIDLLCLDVYLCARKIA